jgi:hypothetical protein
VIERLLAFSMANGTPAPLRASRRRRNSPSRGSILITSAPAIAIRNVA